MPPGKLLSILRLLLLPLLPLLLVVVLSLWLLLTATFEPGYNSPIPGVPGEGCGPRENFSRICDIGRKGVAVKKIH